MPIKTFCFKDETRLTQNVSRFKDETRKMQKIFRNFEIYCKFIDMKRILLLTIFVLVFCFESFGQDCSTVKVIPPSKLLAENGVMLFSVSISGKIDSSKFQYNWSVSQGNIFDGQGTMAITVPLAKI